MQSLTTSSPIFSWCCFGLSGPLRVSFLVSSANSWLVSLQRINHDGSDAKIQVSSLDDIKSTSQNDNNAVKTLALDHLGVIAAHLRTSTLKFKRDSDNSALSPLDEVCYGRWTPEDLVLMRVKITSALDNDKLQQLVSAHQDLQNNLCKRSSEDQAFDVSTARTLRGCLLKMFQSARELTAVMWGHELALTMQHCAKLLIEDGDIDRKRVKILTKQLKLSMRGIWDDPPGDVFELAYVPVNHVRLFAAHILSLVIRRRRLRRLTSCLRRSAHAKACVIPSTRSWLSSYKLSTRLRCSCEPRPSKLSVKSSRVTPVSCPPLT